MRIGLLGPLADGDEVLREAIEFLLGDVEVDLAIYLGENGELVSERIASWMRDIVGDDPSEEAFLDRARDAARGGDADAIDRLLEGDAFLEKLRRVRVLPPPPARAVEMIADRIILAVHDKRVLDEEDIANAHLIVYGKSTEADLRKFGHRYFLTPGPLDAERVAVVEVERDGHVSIALFETSGLPVWRKTMSRRNTKVNVAQ
ncbi:MAG: hypothetical protein AB7S26_13705 [Sandaracinaceae bacterium]